MLAARCRRTSVPSTVQYPQESIRKIDAYWRACNYLSLGMLYLSGNPLLREPLEIQHIKERLIGHWGSDPGQASYA